MKVPSQPWEFMSGKRSIIDLEERMSLLGLVLVRNQFYSLSKHPVWIP